MKIILIVTLAGIVLFCLLLFYTFKPTIKTVSAEPVLAAFLKKQLLLKKTVYMRHCQKGEYDMVENILTDQKEYTGNILFEIPAGSMLQIDAFKTYTNNMGAGFTTLYALGSVVQKNGTSLPYEYSLGYVGKSLYEKEPFSLPLTIWQDSSDNRIQLVKNKSN